MLSLFDPKSAHKLAGTGTDGASKNILRKEGILTS